jgi:methionine-rich copper-binding protein CopC/putative copper export protein
VARRLLAVGALALVVAQQASAHAIPLHAEPPNGAILLTAPRYVSVTFDSSVRVGPRNAAIRNDGTNVLDGVARIAPGNRLVIPLHSGLADGDYTVRWSVVSDDGHEQEGVIVFGLGRSAAQPTAALTTHGFVTWQRVLMRTLFLLGVLGAVGAAFFSLAVLGGDLPRRQAHLLFVSFLLAFAGADALIHVTSASGTRFERFMIVAAVAAGIGAAASALAPLEARLRYLVWAAAATLFVCPTLAGHALDHDQPAVIAPAADLLHLGGAAVWLGGVASLALARTGSIRRFSTYALPAVGVVALGGAARALTELSSLSQIWTTSYGRALLVKTAVFAVLLVLVWLARRRLLLVQLALLTVLAVAIGTLTDLRPGRARATTVRTTPSNVPPPAPGPPPGAYVDAGEAGKLAVAFAWLDGKATVTLVGPDGAAVTDVPVNVTSSGRTFRVAVAGTTLRFDVPGKLRSGAALLHRATHMYDALPAVSLTEALSSGPGNHQTSVFHERAPNRIAYRIESSTQAGITGSESIVIGSRRWDRKPGGSWQLSPQGEIRVPRTYWGSQARNVYIVGPDELTFYDPQVRAWYRLRLAPSGLPAQLTMIGAAHFMSHHYAVGSPSISPPPAR